MKSGRVVVLAVSQRLAYCPGFKTMPAKVEQNCHLLSGNGTVSLGGAMMLCDLFPAPHVPPSGFCPAFLL
jgi:hypothetical protein